MLILKTTLKLGEKLQMTWLCLQLISHTSTFSDDEEEEPVPVDTSLLLGLPGPALLPTAPPVLGSLGAENPGNASANTNLSGSTEDAAASLEPLR